MHTDEDAPRKKVDKAHDSLTVSVEQVEAPTKSEAEDPKPRIVLTFRSEKTSAKTSNMKIVTTDEKSEDFSPRRSSRTRNKWEWTCDSDTSISPKKEKSNQPVSENESDSAHTSSRLRRRPSKESDILANAIARKEKAYNQIGSNAPFFCFRDPVILRSKITTKNLGNDELSTGLDSQSDSCLSISTDKSTEEGVRTRRSTQPLHKMKKKCEEQEVVEIEDDDSQSQSVMKLKHLCGLGLQAIDPEDEDEEAVNDDKQGEESEVAAVEEDEEIDDDSEVISKLLEADEETVSEGSDEDFYCSDEASQSERPRSTRRSARLCSSYGNNDSDQSSPPGDENQKSRPRRSTRRAARHSYIEDADRSSRPKRKRNRSNCDEDAHSEAEPEENSNPAGGDEGSEAACPSTESTIVATCLCEAESNVYAAPSELTEPVFCQAVELVDGARVGCSVGARAGGALVRAGPRAPYVLVCATHAAQMRRHMCCPMCGLFCTQGIFYQCSEGHLFHLECGIAGSERARVGCPHCGVHSYRWQPANCRCVKVQLDMHCTNKRIFLPEQREQCTPAYLGFSNRPPSDQGPVIPEDILPSIPVDLKQMCKEANRAPGTTDVSELNEAILAGETVQQLIPKILSCADVNRPVGEAGGRCVHSAARRAHLAALYVLQYAGADLDAPDCTARTPLLLAVHTLLAKSEKSKNETKDESKDSSEVMETDNEKDSPEKPEPKSDITDKVDCEEEKDQPQPEDLLKLIRYLVAAGCDLNAVGPEEMTALHIAAQHGSEEVCSILLTGGADVDPRDHGGWTPLVWAAENGHEDAVRVLLSHGADATSVDNEGNSCVHWCAATGHARCLRALLQRAPHAHRACNAHADTPLHVAARQGHYACVVVLLARGARTDLENSAGELPVEVCTAQCQAAISLNMQMCALTRRYTLVTNDISNGREMYPVPCINEVDDAMPEPFTYVTQHVTPVAVPIDTSIQTMQGCDCKDGECSTNECACASLSVRAWSVRGRLVRAFPHHDPPMLFQCNETCACNARRCANSSVRRLSARGATWARVAVFRAGGARGWGLRAEQALGRGAPLAAYCGELLPLPLADARAADHYMFALDLKRTLLEQCGDNTALCVDAAQYGSAARFINHSCAPNLAPVRVFTGARDLRLPVVALFATRDIRPQEELTFDYGDKFWSVKSKWMKCECGSPDCRYPVKTSEESE